MFVYLDERARQRLHVCSSINKEYEPTEMFVLIVDMIDNEIGNEFQCRQHIDVSIVVAECHSIHAYQMTCGR
jgi:hypothetical protein